MTQRRRPRRRLPPCCPWHTSQTETERHNQPAITNPASQHMWLLLILALGFQQPFLIMHDPPISSISCFKTVTLRVWATHTSIPISVWAASSCTAQCDICFLVAQSTRSLERIWQSYHLWLLYWLSFPSQGTLGSNFKDFERNSDTFITVGELHVFTTQHTSARRACRTVTLECPVITNSRYDQRKSI